jgi:hypothetical protein
MRAMGVNEGSEDWRAGWHAGMATAVAECRRIVREGGMLETDDMKIGVLEAALAILRLKRSAEDAGT